MSSYSQQTDTSHYFTAETFGDSILRTLNNIVLLQLLNQMAEKPFGKPLAQNASGE